MNSSTETTTVPFSGFRSPNTTPIPDEVFDELLADLSGAEVKVLLYICRRTFGFKKESDTISLNQMIRGIQRKNNTWLDKGTGLSRDSVTRALRGLEERGVIITVKKQSESKGNEVNTYKLNVREPKPSEDSWSENRTRGGVKIGLGVVRKSDSQETVVQETGNKTVNGVWKRLKNLDQPKERTGYVAQFILEQLGDKQSERFYNLIAAKVPEQIIRQALSEIKQDGAEYPERLFTHKVKLWALNRLKAKIG